MEKYNNLFKEIECEMFLSTQGFLGKKFFDYVTEDMNFINKNLFNEVSNTLKMFAEFLNQKINIDTLIDHLSASLINSIKYVKFIKGSSYIKYNPRI